MNLTPFRDNYRKELINQATEKLHIFLNKIECECCNELCVNNIFKTASISGDISKLTRINNEIFVDIDYYEYEKCYCTLDLLDTTTLEYIVFNEVVGYHNLKTDYIKLD